MTRPTILLLVFLLLSGCATMRPGEGGFTERYSGSRQLEQADRMQAKGDTQGAAKTLSTLVNAPSVPGVTDEALFRLALLSLKPGAEKNGFGRAQQLFRRLSREYPKSRWNALAAPVADLVDTIEEQRRQNKNLKGANQSLNKEIGELNRNIEQLKRLDVELEQKVR